MNWDDYLRQLLIFLLTTILTITNPNPKEIDSLTTPRPQEAGRHARTTTDRIRETKEVSWNQDLEVSFYGPGFYGKRTACGLAYTKTIIGVAHRTLPCGTLVDFRYGERHLRVPVIDRGPYIQGRNWDLSGGLCQALRHCFTGPIEWRIVGGG